MLILTRRIGEGVLIGDGIRVVVLEARGKQFRLGIEAPNDVVVLRDEIFQRLTHENLQATTFLLDDLQVLKRAVNGRIPARCHPFASSPQEGCLPIESKFGIIQVPEDQIITFNRGLLGFPNFQRFFLLTRPEISPFLILQCVDHADFAMVLTDPAPLEPGFRLNRLSSIMGDLRVQGPEELTAFVTLTIPSEQPTAATANLVSPILINPKLRLGKQVVLENAQYSHRHRLLPD